MNMDALSNREPTLSVVVPSLNHRRFIAQCLEEPLRLVPKGVEIIVMDGGSTDGTVSYLQETLGSRIHWVSEKDRGQSHAINKGLTLAKGQWVAFQNSDDFYVAEKLEDVLGILKESSADIVIGGMISVNEDGSVFRSSMPKPIFYPCLSQLNFINNQSFFVRRALLDRVGFLDEKLRFCLDYDWFVRILKARPRIHYVPDVIGAQRFYQGTKTSTMKDVHDQEFDLVARRHFSYPERLLGWLMLRPYRLFRYFYGVFR